MSTPPPGSRPTSIADRGEPVGFQYVVLRCVPRVDREEFINIGVVIYCQQTDFLQLAAVVSDARVAALDPTTDTDEVRQALAGMAAICAGDADAGDAGRTSLSQRFGWLAAPRSTVVQAGPIHGGVTSDPAAQLAALLEAFVH
ncbi:MAG: hypothetical protein JWN95_2807 [Frankiales bacterium]|nr:hypothetical protein [Frankiales bacterium]